MNYIFLINDKTSAAATAAVFAAELALASGSKLIVGTPHARRMLKAPILHGAAKAMDASTDELVNCDLAHLFPSNRALYYCSAVQEEVDTADMDAKQLSQLIARYPVSVIIKGNDGSGMTGGGKTRINMQALLNRVFAPIWLIPPAPAPAFPGKLAYITDLRYCRTDVLTRVLSLTRPAGTQVAIIHQAAPGLPDLIEDYAKQLFTDLCTRWRFHDRLTFHHIHEPNIATAADVLINGMQIDGLILANQSTHFKQLITGFLAPVAPALATQLMLFPG